MSSKASKKLAIVVGGGPAPGINGVIRAVTRAAIKQGVDVLGVKDGFKWLARGDVGCMQHLSERDVEWLHMQGGSVLGTSREAPAKDPTKLKNVVESLRASEIGYLVTIGGDDTASSATAISNAANGKIAIAHVPKTIDNDLPLPEDLPTFGFHTARQVGVDTVRNLLIDAKTTGRWYFAVAMGRSAGHLALGIGLASGSPISVIPEQFGSKQVRLAQLSRLLEGSILARAARGYPYGVAIIAEGVAERIDSADLSELSSVERDDHGHIRLAELPFGRVLKNAVRSSLRKLGYDMTIVDKNIGYELRCAPPVAFDMEYTQQLGTAAVNALVRGKSGLLICVKRSSLVELPLQDMLDPETKKMSVRRVDVEGPLFRTAQGHMDYLDSQTLSSEVDASRIASLTSCSVEQLRQHFAA